MAHALPRRGGAPADEADDRLAEIPADHGLGGGLLVAAADLADHDHGAGRRVFLEQAQHLAERQPEDWIATDANGRGLPHAGLTQALDHFVGQRAAARHDADGALPIDVVRDDADLRLAGCDQPRAVRSDQLDAGILDERPRPHHVVKGNSLGDTHNEPDAGGRGFHDRVGGEGGGDENPADVGAGFTLGVGHCVKDGDAEMGGATLARADASDQVRAVGLHLLGMERPLATGQPLDEHPALAGEQDAHEAAAGLLVPAAASSTILRAAALAPASGGIPASFSNCRPSSSRVPVIRTTSGSLRFKSRVASMIPCATSSPRVMPPKMLIRIPFTRGSPASNSSALCTTSAFAPPPISRKSAAWPPSRSTRSRVFITSPAPLPMTPMDPSSRT